MKLEEAQRKKVAGWVEEGVKLSDIQSRIAAEFGVRMTYMDVRLLVDDLKVIPKDVEPGKPAPTAAASGTQEAGEADAPAQRPDKPDASAPAGRGVTVSVDQLTRAGAVVSGKVTFSDGRKADWYFDQSGRLGLLAEEPDYRPGAGDLQEFQTALESELSKLGL